MCVTPALTWLPAGGRVVVPQGLTLTCQLPSAAAGLAQVSQLRLPVGSPLRGAGVTGVRAGQAPMSHPGIDAPAFTLSRGLAGCGVPVLSIHSGSADLGAEVEVAPALSGCPGVGSMGNRHLPVSKVCPGLSCQVGSKQGPNGAAGVEPASWDGIGAEA